MIFVSVQYLALCQVIQVNSYVIHVMCQWTVIHVMCKLCLSRPSVTASLSDQRPTYLNVLGKGSNLVGVLWGTPEVFSIGQMFKNAF
jgi:hypothetical protein